MTKLEKKARTRGRVGGYTVVLLVLGTMGVLYSAVAAPPTSAQENGGGGTGDTPAAQSQADALQQGRDLYLSGCSTCHGLNLEGGSGGPTLIGSGASAVVFQVGSGRMPLNAGLQQAPRKKVRYSQQQIDALAAYVQSNGGGPTLPEGDLKAGDLQLGGALFRTNCASCHNFAGSGGALTYGKYAPELEPANARVVYAAMQSGPESMPRYGDNQLTPLEKRSITRYVEYITAADDPGGAGLGRLGPISEGLVIWVVGIVALVALTLWIGARA